MTTMPDNGTYRCGLCPREHRYLDRTWLRDRGFTNDEVEMIMAEEALKVASGQRKSRPATPKTNAERQAEFRRRRRERNAE